MKGLVYSPKKFELYHMRSGELLNAVKQGNRLSSSFLYKEVTEQSWGRDSLFQGPTFLGLDVYFLSWSSVEEFFPYSLLSLFSSTKM